MSLSVTRHHACPAAEVFRYSPGHSTPLMRFKKKARVRVKRKVQKVLKSTRCKQTRGPDLRKRPGRPDMKGPAAPAKKPRKPRAEKAPSWSDVLRRMTEVSSAAHLLTRTRPEHTQVSSSSASSSSSSSLANPAQEAPQAQDEPGPQVGPADFAGPEQFPSVLRRIMEKKLKPVQYQRRY